MDLDDLADLVGLVRDRTSGVVSIRAGKYEADDAIDLIDASDADLQRVEIVSVEPAMQVLLTPDGARVWAQTDDPSMVRLIDDIRIQVNALSVSRKIVHPWFINLLTVAILLMFGGVILQSAMSLPEKLWAGAGLVAIVVCYTWYAPRSWRYKGAIEVVPLRRAENRTTLIAFKRQVALAAFSGVLGAILGVIGTLLAKK